MILKRFVRFRPQGTPPHAARGVISVQSAQSFHRNLFIKNIPLLPPLTFSFPHCFIFVYRLLSHLSFSAAARSAILQTRDCKIASSRKNLCLYVSFFKKYSRCHMKKRYLCQLLSTGAVRKCRETTLHGAVNI